MENKKVTFNKMIIGFPDYLIYNNGEIWSIATGRKLKPTLRNKKREVKLRRDGKQHTRSVEKLLREHYPKGVIRKPSKKERKKPKGRKIKGFPNYIITKSDEIYNTKNKKFVSVSGGDRAERVVLVKAKKRYWVSLKKIKADLG